MTRPDSVEHSRSGHYWKLKKALYRLKQTGRQQKKCLHKVLIIFGFICAFADNYLYIKYYKRKIILLILVYINNMAVVGPNRYHIISFKLFLGKDFEIHDLGKLKHMLGVLITRDHSRCLIYLSQIAYIQHTITHFGLEDSTLVSISFAVKYNLTLSQSSITKAKKCAFKDYTGDIYYLSLIGLLLFVMQTRPDIQFMVRLVVQFSNNPRIAHLEAAKCILCYYKSMVNVTNFIWTITLEILDQFLYFISSIKFSSQ